MPEVRTFGCNLCEALCGLRVTIDEGRIVDIRGDPDDVFSRGHVCPKAVALKDLHEDPDRLRQPLKRTASGMQPIGWDEAFELVEEQLGRIRKQHGRDAIGFYFGNPSAHSHRAALGVPVLALALRSKNVFSPNSQDANPRLFACLHLYGDPLAVPVVDIDRCDHLLMLGANPAASNGSMWALGDPRGRLQAVRKRGGRIVLLDPRRTETAALSDEHHFVRPGSDAALLMSLLHVLFAERLVDPIAIDGVATGRTALEAAARSFSPERVAPSVGLDAATIRRLARDLASAKRAAVYGRLGLCHGPFGIAASWLVEAVNVVTGNFDREGGVMFPAPAADPRQLTRWFLPKRHGRWRSRVRALPEFLDALPAAVMAEEMETPGPGQIRALITFAGDPVLTVPNGPRLARALEKLEFHVAVDFYRNETTRRADLVLPPSHVFETGNFDLMLLAFTVRNFVRYSPPVLEAPQGTRDNWDILSELALRLATPRALRPALRRLSSRLPEQLMDQLLQRGAYGLTLAQLAAKPHGLDLGALQPSRGKRVRHAGAKVQLAPPLMLDEAKRLEQWLDGEDRDGLVLIGRRHLRSNNSWMHNLKTLVKGPARAHLLMHPLDAQARGLSDEARARVVSRTGSVEVTVKLTEDVMRGVVSLPHGFGHQGGTQRLAEALGAPNANALTDELSVEPVLGCSILTGLSVDVAPIA
jgi:anaerobic selenocysteine-containing dehydrogenase